MSSLQFDNHSLCVVCRDVKCSLDTRCKECKSWSKNFMLEYVKHQRSLVSKGKQPATTSSPSPPVTAVTTAPIVTLPSLPVSEDRFRQLMHSMLQDMLQSGSLGTNQPSTAPPAVPDSAPLSTGATGGLRSVTSVEVPSAESPGVVLPTSHEDPPPPCTNVSVSYVARSRVSNVGGFLSSGLGLAVSVSRGSDHLQVVDVAPSAVVSVASALSPGSLLFPFSDSGFASLSAASSSRPLSLPPPLSSSSFLASSSSGSASLLSSLPPPPPLPPTPAFPSPFALPSLSSRSSFSASALLPPPSRGFPPLSPLVSAPLCSLTLRLLRSRLLFLLSVRPLRQSRLPLLSLLLLPLWTSLRIRLRFWVCLVIISV